MGKEAGRDYIEGIKKKIKAIYSREVILDNDLKKANQLMQKLYVKEE